MHVAVTEEGGAQLWVDVECRVARATVRASVAERVPSEPSSPLFAAGPTDGRAPGVLQIGAEAVEVLGTQCVNIHTAVGEPADLVLAVIVKSHHDAGEMVASLSVW